MEILRRGTIAAIRAEKRHAISHEWITVVHPVFAFVMLLFGAGAMYFLWWYKHYRKIMRVAMHIKSEV